MQYVSQFANVSYRQILQSSNTLEVLTRYFVLRKKRQKAFMMMCVIKRYPMYMINHIDWI